MQLELRFSRWQVPEHIWPSHFWGLHLRERVCLLGNARGVASGSGGGLCSHVLFHDNMYLAGRLNSNFDVLLFLSNWMAPEEEEEQRSAWALKQDALRTVWVHCFARLRSSFITTRRRYSEACNAPADLLTGRVINVDYDSNRMLTCDKFNHKLTSEYLTGMRHFIRVYTNSDRPNQTTTLIRPKILMYAHQAE